MNKNLELKEFDHLLERTDVAKLYLQKYKDPMSGQARWRASATIGQGVLCSSGKSPMEALSLMYDALQKRAPVEAAPCHYCGAKDWDFEESHDGRRTTCCQSM